MNINKKYKTISEWATAYRRVGWNIVPLFKYSKSPASVEVYHEDFGWLLGWKVLQERHATQMEFDYWFKKLKLTGLGVVTGKISKIFVVDEDSYKGDGMKFDFISHFRSKTARGGHHHFFKYTKPIKTSAWRPGINIEIKSDGGFVVLPPSEVQNPDSTGKLIIGKYQWEELCGFDKLPTLTEENLKKYRGLHPNGLTLPVELKSLLKANHGEQHNNLRTIALKMFARFPEIEWDVAIDFIRTAAAKFTPPANPQKVDKLIHDCMKFIASKNDEKKPLRISKYIPKTIREVADERRKERDMEKLAPKTGYAELDALIIGFIPGHVYTMTGDTNVGKTIVACNFAVRVSKQDKKVLYFALEPENTVVDYLASARTGKMFSELTNKDLALDDDHIHIFGKRDITKLENLLEVVRFSLVRYDLIIVDHIGYFIRDKENWIQEQSNLIKELAWLAKDKRTAILLVAHLRKRSANQKKNYIPDADDIAGSGAFKQDSTEVLIVKTEKNSTDPEDFILSNKGWIYVVKTKAGPNGRVEVWFSNNKGVLMTPDEALVQITNPSDKLTLQGFSDNDTNNDTLMFDK